MHRGGEKLDLGFVMGLRGLDREIGLHDTVREPFILITIISCDTFNMGGAGIGLCQGVNHCISEISTY